MTIDQIEARAEKATDKLMQIMERQTTVAYWPWSLFTAEDDEWALHNHNQSLHRLSQRGGLGICELVAILQHRRWQQMLLPDAWRAIWVIYANRTKSSRLHALEGEIERMKETYANVAKAASNLPQTHTLELPPDLPPSSAQSYMVGWRAAALEIEAEIRGNKGEPSC